MVQLMFHIKYKTWLNDLKMLGIYIKALYESMNVLPPLILEVSMFDPTREHDTNPTRVFSG